MESSRSLHARGLLLVASVLTLGATYLASVRQQHPGAEGFRGRPAAEAGLSMRAEQVRQLLQGFERPSGSAPDSDAAEAPCTGSNLGSGDLGCVSYGLEDSRVSTFVEHPRPETRWVVIPRDEVLGGLNAQEIPFVVRSQAASNQGFTQAQVEMNFRSRLVPLFQFAAFYNKDLELLDGTGIRLSGPLHTNGDLYLGSPADLEIWGSVSVGGEMFRGAKHADVCLPGEIGLLGDDQELAPLPACDHGRRRYSRQDLEPWARRLRTGVDAFQVPSSSMLAPVAGEVYWDRADLRVMLDLTETPPRVELREVDGSVNEAGTELLARCDVARVDRSLHDQRRAVRVQLLDIDVRRMLDCIHDHGLLGMGRRLDDQSDGGLVWFLGVDAPDAESINGHGVRLRGGAVLLARDPRAPQPRGLTVATDQALYVQGDFNAGEALNRIPAALLADSLNLLSNNWDDRNSSAPLGERQATATTIRAAFLAGTDSTAGHEGVAGRDQAGYGGGLENFPRLHEDWTGQTLTYRGSFVSLGPPTRVAGSWISGTPQFLPPERDWDYDVDFDQVELLPPLTPRLVYLVQEPPDGPSRPDAPIEIAQR